MANAVTIREEQARLAEAALEPTAAVPHTPPAYAPDATAARANPPEVDRERQLLRARYDREAHERAKGIPAPVSAAERVLVERERASTAHVEYDAAVAVATAAHAAALARAVTAAQREAAGAVLAKAERAAHAKLDVALDTLARALRAAGFPEVR